MRCHFRQDGPGRVRCIHCRRIVLSMHPPERVHARCRGSGEARQPPSLARRAWNLVGSLAAFVADGLQTVTEAEYRARLEICDACPSRQQNSCVECGCSLALKARGRAFSCPLGKWPEIR